MTTYNKYCLTDDTINFFGKKLYRIKALRNFGDVKAGDLGGYISGDHNLSHNGKCWVYDNAWVTGYTILSGEDKVSSGITDDIFRDVTISRRSYFY